MGIPSKQIGWSQESILLHAVSKQLERLAGIIATSGGGGGGGATNLGYIAAPGQGTITSSTGFSAIVPLATGTNAGLLSPADFTKIATLNSGSGILNYLVRWTGTNSQGNSQIFDNGSSVGVGTNTPSNKFTVESDVTQLALRLATDPNKQLLLGYDLSNNAGVIQPVQQTVGFMNLLLNPSGGSVGIGVSIPSTKLHIASTSNTTLFRADSNTGTALFGIDDTRTIIQHSAGNSIDFVSNGGLTRMTITSTGTVGIGVPSPTQKLEVAGNILATAFIKSGGTAAQYLMADGSVSTLTNPVTGTGTTNLVARWTSASTLGTGVLIDDGTNASVGVGPVAIAGYRTFSIGGAPGAVINLLTTQIVTDTTSTYINETRNVPLRFLTNGLERVTILGTGNVGIGLTSNINDKLTLGSVAQEAVGYGFRTPASNWGGASSSISFQSQDGINADTNFSVNLWKGTGGPGGGAINSRLFINGTTGNVGIGTVAPNAKATFRVATSTGSASADGITVNDSDTNPQGLHLGVNTASSYSWIQSLHQGFGYEKLILNPNGGNVGIGTTSPTANIDVLGGNTNSSLTFGASALATFGSTIRQLAINSTFNGSDYLMSLQARTNGNTVSYLSLNPLGGNVGIGTTSPTGKLQVECDNSAQAAIVVNSNVASTGSGSIQYWDNGVAKWNLGTNPANDFILFNQDGPAVGFALVINKANGSLKVNNLAGATVRSVTVQADGTLSVGAPVATQSIRSVTANTTALSSDYTILADATSGALTIALPAAATLSGQVIGIKKINNTANNITIDPNGSELIDFALTYVLSTYLQTVLIQSDGTAWYIIN